MTDVGFGEASGIHLRWRAVTERVRDESFWIDAVFDRGQSRDRADVVPGQSCEPHGDRWLVSNKPAGSCVSFDRRDATELCAAGRA